MFYGASYWNLDYHITFSHLLIMTSIDLFCSWFLLQISNRHASLTIKSADKEDGAVYRLDLENKLGQDSANLEFTVNGEFLSVCGTMDTRKSLV